MLILPKNIKKRQSGQALLLILLMMSLVLTMVLSSVSRSVTDVDISTYEDSAIRAFDAAQAGVEKIMIEGTDQLTPVPLTSNATYTSITSTVAEVSNTYKYPVDLISGETATFFFVNHKENSEGDYVMDSNCTGCINPEYVDICWGKEGTPDNNDETPAVYLEFYYDTQKKWMAGDLSSIEVATASADPYDTRRSTVNNFSQDVQVGKPCGNLPYEFGRRFLPTNIDYDNYIGSDIPDSVGEHLFVRVTMLYNSSPHPLWISSPQIFPVQGSVIESTGNYGDVSRKLLLRRGYPEFPAEFGSALFSQNGLVK